MLVLHKLDDVDSMTTLDLADSDWYVTHAYNGFDTLQFEVPVNSKYYKDLHEECRVTFIGSRNRDMRFIVKNIDEHSIFVTVDCDIDLDEWKASIIQSFRTTNSTLDTVISKLLPSGWSKSGMEKYTKRTTVEKTEGEPIEAVTPLEVLDYVTEAYGCVFNFDNVNRVIYAVNPDEEVVSGEYISDELNLTSRPGFVGNSSSFATRLYAYGKKDEDTDEPLTFADINDGKPYVEDFSYSDKIICVGWSDERYTVAEDLLEAAKEKLKEVCKPTRSYSCDVAQLNYNVWMYRVVTLLDSVRNVRVDHQVVEWKERADPSLDEVSLSAVAPDVESLIKQGTTVDDKIAVSELDTKNAYIEAIEENSKKIAGSYGGYFKWIYDSDGNPMELVNLGDSEDISKATKVWRWNKEGLGHSNKGYDGEYDLALMADGSINANMITVGIIRGGKSYWNLNTGKINLQGTFTASYTDVNTNITQTLVVKPSFRQYDDAAATEFYGPAVVFGSSEDGSTEGYITRVIERNDKYDMSSIDINGGRKSSDSPGGFLRVGSNRNDDTQILDGYVLAKAKSDYSSSSSNSSKLVLLSKKDGSETYATLYAQDSSGIVGMKADISTGHLYLGGILSGYGSGRATAFLVYWNTAQTANEFQYTTFNATVSTPAKYGYYTPFATVDAYLQDSHYIVCSVSDKTASGWRIWTQTFPSKLVRSVSASWTKTTVSGVSGVCKDLSVNVNSSNLFNSFTYLLYTIGILTA